MVFLVKTRNFYHFWITPTYTPSLSCTLSVAPVYMFPRRYVILRQDSVSFSRSPVLSEGSVWRVHPDRNREGENIFYDAPESGEKYLALFSCIWTNVDSKCWQLVSELTCVLVHVKRVEANYSQSEDVFSGLYKFKTAVWWWFCGFRIKVRTSFRLRG